MRRRLLWLHRYVGLVLALFLLLAGLTGALLVWYEELDAALNPRLMRVEPPAPDARPLDALALRSRVQAAYPQLRADLVSFKEAPNRARSFWLTASFDPAHTTTEASSGLEVFVDPYSGAVLGSRRWGDIGQGLTNLMPFVYRLHYQLALGTVGTWLFGLIALLWTLDCFVGAYLTLPATPRTRRNAAPALGARWWARWRPAWSLRWNAGAHRLQFDLHRAGGLWLWALLLVFAWSSVGLNLSPVYTPVMGLFFDQQTRHQAIPALPEGPREPAMDWPQAVAHGQQLMAEAAEREGFQVVRADRLAYDPQQGVFRYTVRSSRDVMDKWGATSLYFAASTGESLALFLPSGKAAGDTLTSWFYGLHFAALWGLPWRLFVTLMGLAVATLSLTGVLIWWRKRSARGRSRQQRRATPCPTEQAPSSSEASAAGSISKTGRERGALPSR
ncbi:MAG: PepSY-associated TM helix domain-containing protein [Pseudomonadota bacterium]